MPKISDDLKAKTKLADCSLAPFVVSGIEVYTDDQMNAAVGCLDADRRRLATQVNGLVSAINVREAKVQEAVKAAVR